MESKTGKKIVSREAYWRMIGVKCYLVIWSILMLVFAVVYCPLSLWRLLPSNPNSSLRILLLLLFVPMLPLGCCMVYWTLRAIKETIQIDPGTPVTRANTADLPAPDSLVRASEQPLQAQKAILLRATVQGQETLSEQLVRPAQ